MGNLLVFIGFIVFMGGAVVAFILEKNALANAYQAAWIGSVIAAIGCAMNAVSHTESSTSNVLGFVVLILLAVGAWRLRVRLLRDESDNFLPASAPRYTSAPTSATYIGSSSQVPGRVLDEEDCASLSAHEQQIWNEIELQLAQEGR